MGQLYCFSCGKSLSDAEQDRASGAGPVPMCDSCRSAGPQVDPGDIRWMIRRAEERPQGPLAREAIIERLARDALGPYDQVCRVNSEWQRLVEHSDFRGCFIPGTPERNEVEKLKNAINSEKSAETSRQRRRVLRATALLAVGIVLPVVTTTTGLGVLPERWVDSIQGVVGGLWGEAKGVISSASDQDQARQSIKSAAGLPAQNAVSRLKDAYPKVEEPLELLLARGEASLWKGSVAGFQAARDDFERAVAKAPEDPAAVAGLTMAYAALLEVERGQIVTVVDLAQRAEALAPGSASALKAAALAAMVGGDTKRAAELAQRCVELKPEGAAPGATVKPDPGCLGLHAAATLDAAAAEALDSRYPNRAPVSLVRLFIATASSDWGTDLRVGRALGKRAGDDPLPWAFVATGAYNMGLWREARDAAERVAKAAPWRLDIRLMQAQILLKVDLEAAAALPLYQAILADERWADVPNKAAVWTDASAAALELGKTDLALTWTEAALKEDNGYIAAVLVRARALKATGKEGDVEPLLATIDNARLTGREGARYLLGVGAMHLDAGRSRPATQALDLALELDPSYPPIHLERALAYLKAGNPAAAVQQLEELALSDATLDRARSPLTRVWSAPGSWTDLRRDLEAQALADVRLAPRAPSAIGVVAWAGGQGDARAVLQRALDANPNSTPAHAAMAWLLVERGEPGAALPHIERVLSDQPQSGLFHALKGRALAMQGRFDDAERAFGQAMVNAAKQPSVYRWRAEARMRAGKRDGARSDLETALELAPGDLASAALLVDLQEQTK